MSGCGGGTDYASNICDKAKSCDPTWTASDLATCKTQANQALSKITGSQKDAIDKEMDQCLAMTDCSLFYSCFTTVQSMAGGTGGTGGTAAPSTY
jgi:hypothetical protein